MPRSGSTGGRGTVVGNGCGGGKGGKSKHRGKISSVTTKPNKWIRIIPNKEGIYLTSGKQDWQMPR